MLRFSLLAILTGAIFTLSILGQDRTQLPALVIIALAGSGVLVWLWHLNTLTHRQILIFAVLFRLAMVWLPPSLSDDAFRYVWDGMVQAEGVNPYQYKPSDPALAELQDGEVYDELNSKEFYSVYPPVSQYVFYLGSFFSEYGWEFHHYIIKGLLVLAELLALLLLARIVSAPSLLLYALNPIVLLETAGQGHTESLLLLLLIGVILSARAGRGTWASIALAAATWVKLWPLVLLPFVWRRFGWRSLLASLGAMVVIALPYAAFYVPGNVMESLDLYEGYFEFNAGFYYTIKEIYYWFTGMDYSKQIGPALRTLFLIGLPIMYLLDWWKQWSLVQAFLMCFGLYVVFSTTIHPWYLITPLFLMAMLDRPVWGWFWLGALSIGTYLLYVNGPYWEFVIIGWSGGVILGILQYGKLFIQRLLRIRAAQKVRLILPFFPRLRKPLNVLDLGCGEGYVGEQIQERLNAQVALADIVDLNKTSLEHTVCASGSLPWKSDTFDVVVLYFVLHHCQDPIAVLREARRVSRQRIMVVESVYKGDLGLRLLTALDIAANRMRNWHVMAAQEEHLSFKTAKMWREIFTEHGLEIQAEFSRGKMIDRKQVFILDKVDTSN